jgi:hypothetical protein
MARDTIVQIFSMTKPITGVALMQLYERGKFELDAPLAVYAPEFAEVQVYAGARCQRPAEVRSAEAADHRARHPAAHRGFNGDGAPEAVTAIYRRSIRATEQRAARVIAKLAPVPLAYQPGTQVEVQRRRRRAGLSRAEDLRRAVRRIPQAAHLPSARHDLDAIHHPVPRIRSSAARRDLPRNEDGTFTRQTDEEAYTVQQRRLAVQAGQLRAWCSTIDDYRSSRACC